MSRVKSADSTGSDDSNGSTGSNGSDGSDLKKLVEQLEQLLKKNEEKLQELFKQNEIHEATIEKQQDIIEGINEQLKALHETTKERFKMMATAVKLFMQQHDQNSSPPNSPSAQRADSSLPSTSSSLHSYAGYTIQVTEKEYDGFELKIQDGDGGGVAQKGQSDVIQEFLFSKKVIPKDNYVLPKGTSFPTDKPGTVTISKFNLNEQQLEKLEQLANPQPSVVVSGAYVGDPKGKSQLAKQLHF